MGGSTSKRVRTALGTKLLTALALVAAADLLLFRSAPGAGLGLFAVACILAAGVAHPELGRDRRARAALLAALLFALLEIETTTLIGWLMFGAALGIAVLSPRAARSDGAWRWAQRLALLAAAGSLGPLLDVAGARRRRRRDRGGLRVGLASLVALFALPAAGAVVFLALFASANPLISQALDGIAWDGVDLGRICFWGVAGVIVWSVLRPRFLRRPLALPQGSGDLRLPGVSAGSVLLSLIVFNALFAVENGLDLAFLWSGAPLPAGVTLADYAHRGAYPLVATAILAGLFVLVALRPGSDSARSRPIRWLVGLWTAQNMLLVASSALRTIDYVQAYSLTVLRIAALAWMGLVAVGLGLILWRMLRSKSADWLLNANAAAAALVLTAASVVDLGSVAAAWNVRHAREAGGAGAPLDVDYLARLGPSALVSLSELEQRPLPPLLHARVDAARASALARLRFGQSDWRSWTARGARRLQRAAALAPAPAPLTSGRRA